MTPDPKIEPKIVCINTDNISVFVTRPEMLK